MLSILDKVNMSAGKLEHRFSCRNLTKLLWLGALIPSAMWTAVGVAAEVKFSGVVDVRAHVVSSDASNSSYLKGDFGKFRFDDGLGFSLGQLGLKSQLSFDNNWSATIVANAFSEEGHLEAGITEAYARYKSIPDANGWRWGAKVGLFYPEISLEHIATAWSNPYTLTSSALNNWVGEELRSLGGSLSVEKLGKFNRSNHDFSFAASVFQNNDPAGAMIPWHGWTIGSRQTLIQERLVIPYFPALSADLSAQARHTDPFLELDDRWGLHVHGSWRYKKHAKLSAGFYDNHAREGIVKQGHYTWTTRFSHVGGKYKIGKNVELIGQYLSGNTYMTSPTGVDVVNSDFSTGYLLTRYLMGKSQIAVRAELFDVDDKDSLPGDNNNENGKSLTLSYRHQLSRQSFVFTEYNWVSSNRPARMYAWQPESLIERQYQLGYRFYF